MRRKEVNRARRQWDEIQKDLHDNRVAADFARRWSRPLLDEVKRLRKEIKTKEALKELELECDDLDELIDEIERLQDDVPAEIGASVDAWWLNDRINKILKPYMEDHDAGDK